MMISRFNRLANYSSNNEIGLEITKTELNISLILLPVKMFNLLKLQVLTTY